jgi:hypothetical protein
VLVARADLSPAENRLRLSGPADLLWRGPQPQITVSVPGPAQGVIVRAACSWRHDGRARYAVLASAEKPHDL